MRSTAILLLLATLLPSLAAAETVAGRARVVDGDTIEIQDQRIRLWGIDAPEVAQRCTEGGKPYPCGLDASQALRRQIGRKAVTCTRRDTDRYGRMVAVCRLGGLDISQWMVQQGQAIAYRKYSLDYVADEGQARAGKVGLWAGEFQDPSEFRHPTLEPGASRTERRPPAGRSAARRVCNCPDDTDRAGRRCGGRSAHMRAGGAQTTCATAR